MSRSPVWVRDSSFDAALAQLPERVERAQSPGASIIVLDGRRERPERVEALLAERPIGAVLTHPASASQAVVDQLAHAGIRVVTVRSLLRADDAAIVAGATVRHLVLDALASRADVRATLVDAIGWARVIVGGGLTVSASARTRESLLVALESPAGIGVALTATRLVTSIAPALTVDGLGERRVGVRIDRAAGVREIAIHGEEGVVVAAPRYESSERLALRRALAAAAGDPVDDLVSLIHDRSLADELLGATKP
ncbi:UNVERIFIED_CONTAM: hypothetical protein OHV15_06945 [Microbacterium sp. SLM126]